MRPARGASSRTAATAAAPRGAAVTAPTPRPPAAPRRVSGPAPPARPARRSTVAARPVGQPLHLRAWVGLRALPDHSLLDRIVRGRLWIPLLGVLLAGIVASQVEILKLNASIGNAVVRSGQLQSQDQQLAETVSKLSDDQRIMTTAAGDGLSMPAPSTPLYLGHGSGELTRAIANIHAPDPTSFAARTSATATDRAALVTASSGQ